MSIELNKNQALNKQLKNVVINEACDAIKFLPAEDKVNLGLKLVATPCIDDKSSMAEVLSNAQDTIEELTATVGALQSELNTRQATGTE